jgi:Flp pilus assembly protein TadD
LRPDILEELSAAALAKLKLYDFDMAMEIAEILDGLFPKAQAILHLKTVILETEAQWLDKGGRKAELQFIKKEAHKAAKREEDSAFAAEISKLLEENKADDALRRIKAKLENHASSKRLWFLLGWSLRTLKRWDDAKAALQKALELGAKNTDVRNELAICQLESGDFKAARRTLEEALLGDSGNTKIISNLGVLALRQGNRAEAMSFFKAVLEYDPGDPLALEYVEKENFDLRD